MSKLIKEENMKTIKEIAKICEVSEQAIRGWCRRNNVAKDAKGTFAINETIEYRIYEHYMVDVAKLNAKPAKPENNLNEAIIELLRNELEYKNKQIDELNKRLTECQKLLDQEQQLKMIGEQKLLQMNEKISKKVWWKKLFEK